MLGGSQVMTAEGSVSDFGALQQALGCHGGSRELAYIAFDLLHLDGRDLRRVPLIERKAMLLRNWDSRLQSWGSPPASQPAASRLSIWLQQEGSPGL
jgi:ATP-dependent DNA ligase